MTLSHGAKAPLIMFALVLAALCVTFYLAGKASAGFFAIAFLASCMITWRWSDKDSMPRWLFWGLLAPVIVVIAALAYFLATGRIAA